MKLTKQVENVNQIPSRFLEKYIYENLRQTSPKTGKPIRVNSYKQSKPWLLKVIECAECESNIVNWFNSKQTFVDVEEIVILQAWDDNRGCVDPNFGEPLHPLLPYGKNKCVVTLVPDKNWEDCFYIFIDNNIYGGFTADSHNIVNIKRIGNKLILTSCIGWG